MQYYRSLIKTAPPPQLLLDVYSGAATAYSLRKIRAAYSGAAIRVRRDNDNAEQDIGFDGSGNLDETALTAFVGANNGFVVTWYDQSGNSGRNATQATAGNQPRIVNAGVIHRMQNNRPCMRSSSTNRLTTSVTSGDISISGSSVRSIITVQGIGTNHTECGFSYGNAPGGQAWQPCSRYGAGSGIDIGGQFRGRFVYAALITVIVPSGATTGNDLLIYTNTSSITDAVAGSNQTLNTGNTTLTIGNAQAFGAPGNLHEVIIYSTDESSNRTGIESNINTYYGIY